MCNILKQIHITTGLQQNCRFCYSRASPLLPQATTDMTMVLGTERTVFTMEELLMELEALEATEFTDTEVTAVPTPTEDSFPMDILVNLRHQLQNTHTRYKPCYCFG